MIHVLEHVNENRKSYGVASFTEETVAVFGGRVEAVHVKFACVPSVQLCSFNIEDFHSSS